MAKIEQGYILFSVVAGSTSINLDRLFPGAGIVHSDGVPIDPARWGDFSTGLIRRGELPDGESGVVPVEMFAEHSVSTEPVPLAPFGAGDGYGDFHTIINLGGALPNLPNTDGLVRPSTGVMAIKRTRGGGGRFDLLMNINVLIVMTKKGGSVADLNGPDVLKVIDASGVLNPVTSIGGQWLEESVSTKTIHDSKLRQATFFGALDRSTGEPASIDLLSGGPQAEAQRVVRAARFL